MSRQILFISLLTILISSCSTVRLKSRAGKDTILSDTDFKKIQGTYTNGTTNPYRVFSRDTLHRKYGLSADLIPVNKNAIQFVLKDKNVIIDSLTIKGKYRRGYFKVKREFRTKFIAGPLLWIFGESIQYIGLTKENNLVVMDSGGAGYMLLVAFPIFVAGGGQTEMEFKREK